MKTLTSGLLCLVVIVCLYLPAKSQALTSLYTDYADITIDNAMVSGSTDLNNFVLLIALSSNTEMRTTGNGGQIQSNGWDIVFAPNSSSNTGSEYKHDLESYDGATGELVIWVQVDLSASADTDFTMFYGRGSVGADPSDNTLWTDANYIGVWQLSETPGAGTVVDAAGISSNGTTYGDVAVDASSIVGQGYSFDGTGDYVLIPENATIEPTGSFTISCWFNTAGVQNDYAKMFSKGETDAPYGSYTLEMRPNGGATNHDEEVGFQTGRQDGAHILTDSNGNGEIDISTGDWNFFAGVIDDAGGPNITQRFYLNGDLISTSTASSNSAIDYYVGTYDLTIGGIYDGAIFNEFQGTIDELRLASVVRSQDYLRTEVRNTACVSNYMTITGSITGLTCTDSYLPVEFKSFQARRTRNQVSLEWSTASELNNDYFTVEKSYNGINFHAIGTVEGAGNSNELLKYSFTDSEERANLVYYRIKQTDYDGQFDYSRLEKIIGTSQGIANISIYPNPIETGQQELTVSLSEVNSNSIHVNLLTLSGQLVYSETINEEHNIGYIQHKIDPALFDKGNYILRVITDGQSFTEHLLIR